MQATRANWADTAAELARRHSRPGTDEYLIRPAMAEALSGAGFARHFVPERWGGRAGSFEELVEAVAVVGESCPSTAWCAALYAAHGRLASRLPETAQRELWGDGPDVRIAAAVVPPSGQAVPEPGGWRLSGRWSLASGVDHARWVLLASRTEGPDGPEHRIFAVPRSEVSVSDTWRGVGLSRSGSNDIGADGVLVPRHRTMTLDDLSVPLPPVDRAGRVTARCHQVPYLLVSSLIFAAPLLGAARGALAVWLEAARGRRRPGGGGVLDGETAQQVLARSDGEIQAAGLLLLDAARRADRAPVDDRLVAENGRDAALAVDWLVTAVERLFRAGGSAAQREGDPLQRYWRDIHTGSAHGALDFAAAARRFAESVG